MHGASGSGKSWLSERLIGLLRAIRLRSDVERKRHPVTARELALPYSPAAIDQIYAVLGRFAEASLSAGFNTIIDASFLQGRHRELFARLASRLGVRYIIVSCKASPGAMRERLQRRMASSDPSEADISVLEAQLRDVRPFKFEELGHVVDVDTTLDHAEAAAFATLQARTANLAHL